MENYYKSYQVNKVSRFSWTNAACFWQLFSQRNPFFF